MRKKITKLNQELQDLQKARSHELLVRTHDFYEVLAELIRTET